MELKKHVIAGVLCMVAGALILFGVGATAYFTGRELNMVATYFGLVVIIFSVVVMKVGARVAAR